VLAEVSRATDREPAMSSEEARVAITETMQRMGIAETVLGEADATLPRRDATESAPARLPDLAIAAESGEISTDGLPPASTDFVARGVLGRGGMGVVRLAQQRSLERDVAVKTGGKSERAMRALVREARITGGLEHPNVVPVHALGIDREGAPVLVMKRIEGVAWRTLIHDDEHEAWRPLLAGHGDRTRAHIEILAQVARALVFAHDRGVVHRDVKPQNVMIGRFGEVYLLDWGVAMRLDERAIEPPGIVGTPGYLAPEMARGDARLIGAHTDVYLLGATLYEVLTRKPPHDAPNALAALVGALVGEPPAVPADAPRELVQLVRSAMARDPVDRLESAEAFREELARYLVTREADRVHQEGRAALARAEERIAVDGPAAPDAFRALIEARFALGSTIRTRNDSESAQVLDRCLSHLVEREMALGSPIGARTLVQEMSAPSPELAVRIAMLERALEDQRTAAEDRERARRDADSSLSLPAMIAIIVTILTLCVLVYGAIMWGEHGDIEGRRALTIWLAPILAYAIGGIVARRQMFATRSTRQLAGFLGIVLLTPFVTTLVGVYCSVPMHQRSAFSWVASAGVALLGELAVLPRVWPCVVVYLLGTAAVLIDAELTFPVQAMVIVGTAIFFVRSLLLHAAESKVAAER
jgi:hypothetical protein